MHAAELCDGGGLVERLAASATYCEREVAWLMRQLLAAVAHLHQNAIVHMDIKPENVVFATRWVWHTAAALLGWAVYGAVSGVDTQAKGGRRGPPSAHEVGASANFD